MHLENFKEVNSDQYTEEVAFTESFGLRNLNIPKNYIGLNNKQLNTSVVDRFTGRKMKMFGANLSSLEVRSITATYRLYHF